MSTNAYICLEFDDNHIEYIYNHFDGYIEHLGKVLFNFFKTKYDVQKLLELGDASFIEYKFYSLEEILKNSEFYHRDRNEDWDEVKSKICNSRNDIPNIDYTYLFSNGEWYISTKNNFKLLKEFI